MCLVHHNGLITASPALHGAAGCLGAHLPQDTICLDMLWHCRTWTVPTAMAPWPRAVRATAWQPLLLLLPGGAERSPLCWRVMCTLLLMVFLVPALLSCLPGQTSRLSLGPRSPCTCHPG